MARKSLGFIPLIWVCPSCGTQNPGQIKSCTACGAPQPDDIEFLRVDEEQFNFIKDEALIRMAKAGPDIHCPYCGTRNTAGTEYCKKCGGEISLGGKARKTGGKVRTAAEAQQAQASARPSEPTPKPKKKLSTIATILIAIAGLALIAACIVVILILTKTEEIKAVVTDVQWERSIAIEAYSPVTKSDWWDEIPADGELMSCTEKHRYTSDEPTANATEVCGEEYVEDTGTGVGEVVQDCVYEVYDDYCDYTVMEWVVVETVTETGDDLDPFWPNVALMTDEREGERTEEYTIFFADNNKTYEYTTSDEALFLMADSGSDWVLDVSKLGVRSAEPAN
jgi:uncharacterized OB-fold protein